MANLMSAQEIVDHLTEGWGDRDVYHVEEEGLNLLQLQEGAQTFTKNNGDDTITVTVLFHGKTFIRTKRAVSM